MQTKTKIFMSFDASLSQKDLTHCLSKRPSFNQAYSIHFSEPNRHMIYVTQRVKNLDKTETISFKLPAWRPGRYTIQNYAAMVSKFQALSNSGELQFHKFDKQTWVVQTQSQEWITIAYQFFAPGPVDAGNCYLAEEEIFLNNSNMLMQVESLRTQPALLQLHPPQNWQTAVDLEPLENDSHTYRADSYDELIDSPVLITPNLKHIQFETQSTSFDIYAQSEALYHETGFEDEKIIKDLSKIIDEQCALMQDNPLARNYAFMYHFLPYRFYHGVEHAYTCSIVLGPASDLKEKYNDFLGISSHEFFHLWCVKRIMPDAFAPYDYSREAYTTLLYIFEGFTSYYGDLTLFRCGLWSAETYLESLGKAISYVQNNYGRTVQTLADSSFNAWLTGYRRGADLNSINFYVKGLLVGLCLDFELRHRTGNKVTLDHIMRELNDRYAKQNKGFNEQAFEALVEELSGSSFKEFFDNFVRSTNEIPYNDFLCYCGLELETTPDKNTPSLGVVMEPGESVFPTVKFPIPESPAFLAGLNTQDQLVAINEHSLQNEKLNDILKRFHAGETVEIAYFHGKQLRRATLTLEEKQTYQVKRLQNLTPEQEEFWLNWSKSANA